MKRMIAIICIFAGLLGTGCSIMISMGTEPEIKINKSKFYLGEPVTLFTGIKVLQGWGPLMPDNFNTDVFIKLKNPDGTFSKLISGVHYGDYSGSKFKKVEFDEKLNHHKEFREMEGKYEATFTAFSKTTAPITFIIEKNSLAKKIKVSLICKQKPIVNGNNSALFELRIVNNTDRKVSILDVFSSNNGVVVFDSKDKNNPVNLAIPISVSGKKWEMAGAKDALKAYYDWDSLNMSEVINIESGKEYVQMIKVNDDKWLNSFWNGLLKNGNKDNITKTSMRFPLNIRVYIGNADGEYKDFCPISIPVESQEWIEVVKK